MEIPIKHGKKDGRRAIICDAHIPLFYVKNISNGAIKKLATKLHVTTVEELCSIKKECISDSIKNSRLRKEIFAVRHSLEEKIRVKRTLLQFEEIAASKNIKLRPQQRQRLTGVEIFAKILKNIKDLLKLLLGIGEDGISYRERVTLNKLHSICLRAIQNKI